MALNTIILTWQDNSSDEDGFKIYKSTDSSSYNYIATVGVGIQTYTVVGLLVYQSYWFRVTSYNSTGESAYVQAGPINCSWTIPPQIHKMRRVSRNRKTM